MKKTNGCATLVFVFIVLLVVVGFIESLPLPVRILLGIVIAAGVIYFIYNLIKKRKEGKPIKLFSNLSKEDRVKNIDVVSLQNDLRIINDCAKLIEQTVNPAVFFDRFELYMDKMANVAHAEDMGSVKVSGESVSEKYKSLNTSAKKEEIIREFIERYWSDVHNKANALKTENGKMNKISKAHEIISEYYIRMPDTCMAYSEQVYKKISDTFSRLKGVTSKAVVQSSHNNSSLTKKWFITVSFGKTTSSNIERAIYLAKEAKEYKTEVIDGETIHTATFTSDKDQFIKFTQLYSIIKNWKSTGVFINGEIVDKKSVSQIVRCYGDKCRGIDWDTFCFGASMFTANPFGCHRLQISASNHPFWSFYEKQPSGKCRLKKKEMIERIMAAKQVFSYCPSFDIDYILQVANSLPLEITQKELDDIIEKHQSLYTYRIDI